MSKKKAFPLEPLGDKIVVRQKEAADKSKGGIIIPGPAKEKPKEGTVVAVGPGQYLENGDLLPMNVAVGDYVLFASYAGTEVKVDDEAVLILGQSDVLAKMKTNATS